MVKGNPTKDIFDIMHNERRVACIDTHGHCKIYYKTFMPYNFILDENDTDIDALVNNVTNFYYWCATRLLTLDRQYAKEILNSIGASQAVTDKDRAQIALSYHCLSLTDVYWVKRHDEKITYQAINLYDNHLENAFVDIALRGRQMTVQNSSLAQDLSTNGCFPKAWLRTENGFTLLKDGGLQAVDNEILASKICQCFKCRQVDYREGFFEDAKVSISDIMTTLEYSIVSREAFDIYACNKDIDAAQYILRLDAYSYYMMNILDYLVGNTDRHWGNWGFLIDNKNNKPVSIHPLMDFNQSFHAYDTTDGANCQTVLPLHMTQKEAAIDAVKAVGLNQVCEVEKNWFGHRESDYQMFLERLNVLKRKCTHQ